MLSFHLYGHVNIKPTTWIIYLVVFSPIKETFSVYPFSENAEPHLKIQQSACFYFFSLSLSSSSGFSIIPPLPTLLRCHNNEKTIAKMIGGSDDAFWRAIGQAVIWITSE